MSKVYNQIKEIIENNLDFIDDNISKEYLANDETTINVVRNTYVLEFSDLSDKLDELLNNKEYQAILDLVHRVKGVSLYIGSQVLYDCSSYICECIRKHLTCDDEIKAIIALNKVVCKSIKEKH